MRQNDEEFALNILRQLPTLFLVTNFNHEFTFINEYSAKLLGYSRSDSALGETPKDIRCKAAECADLFVQQNNQVIRTKEALTLLDMHAYADQKVKLLLTQKTPYYDFNGEITACICQSTEITSKILQEVFQNIAKSDSQFRDKRNSAERSYILGSSLEQDVSLTKREEECLFHLIRGRTAHETANYLLLSHRTIEGHIERLKCKFECNKKSELIEIAISRGYLNIIPKSFFNNEFSIDLGNIE